MHAPAGSSVWSPVRWRKKMDVSPISGWWLCRPSAYILWHSGLIMWLMTIISTLTYDLIIFCTCPNPFQKTIIIVILIISLCSLFCVLVLIFHRWCEFLNVMWLTDWLTLLCNKGGSCPILLYCRARHNSALTRLVCLSLLIPTGTIGFNPDVDLLRLYCKTVVYFPLAEPVDFPFPCCRPNCVCLRWCERSFERMWGH